MAAQTVSNEKQNLNIAVVTTDPTNDLYLTLDANFDGILLCASVDEAVPLLDSIRGLMILADKYPSAGTVVTAEQAEAIIASDVRVYIEYPQNNELLGITGYTRTEVMGSSRGVVTDADAMQMPLYSLLYVNGARFTRKSFDAKKAGTDENQVWMVSAKVAGYDVSEYALKDTTPYVLLEENDRVLTAATKFSQWISARYAPYDRYQTFWASVLTWLNHGEPVPVMEYELAVRAAYAKDAPLTEMDYVNSVRRNADWLFKTGFLLSDADEKSYKQLGTYGSQAYTLHPDETSDGHNGVIETFSSGAQFQPDGMQKIRFLRRSDNNSETAGALAMAYHATGDERYREAAYNLVEWLLEESSMSGGARADIYSPQYGLFDWDDSSSTPEIYYGEGDARSTLGLIEAISVLGEEGEQYEQRLLELILANFRTTGKSSYRSNKITASDLEKNGWEYYWNRDLTNFAPHYESMLWGGYLWAYEKTGWEPLLERTKIGIALMMDAYDEDAWRWTNGLQQERARMILPLAWLVRLEPTEEHEVWLHRMVNDIMMFQQDCGGIQERLGKGQGTYGSFKSNAAYGGTEAPIIQNNGDPCVDNLYTQEFALIGLIEAVHATANEAYREEYAAYLNKLVDFVVRIQQVSDVYEEFDGVWFRAFDYEKWETYGSDGDAEWGVWTTETGWTQAWLSSGISLYIGDTSIWDLSSSVDLTDDFALVKEIMLDTIIVDEKNIALKKIAVNGTSGTDAASVIDGNIQSSWESGIGETHPAIIVDLLGRFNLTKIRVFTGVEPPSSALQIYTSLDGNIWTAVTAEKTVVSGIERAFDFLLEDNIKEARYIKVENTEPSAEVPFVLHEIKVYGEQVSSDLEIAVYSAEVIDRTKFTQGSLLALEEALKAGRVIYENSGASDEEIRQAADTIRQAENALVSLKPEIQLLVGDIQNYSIDTLVDGVYGSLEPSNALGQIFPNGTYTGIMYTPLVIMVDLREVKTFDRLSMGFLMDGGKWGIEFPASVKFQISKDNQSFQDYAVIDLSTIGTSKEAYIHRAETDAGAAEAQYVKITVSPRKNAQWFFADEFTVHETNALPEAETPVIGNEDIEETISPVNEETAAPAPAETAASDTETDSAGEDMQSQSSCTAYLPGGAAAAIVTIAAGGILMQKKQKKSEDKKH